MRAMQTGVCDVTVAIGAYVEYSVKSTFRARA